MLQKRKCRLVVVAIFVLGILTLLLSFSHFNKDTITVSSSAISLTPGIPKFELPDLHRDYDFDIEEDVLVFLHIQKTGGTTFEHHLVEDLDVEIPCERIKGQKRRLCENSKQDVWIFSRYTTGWACGLHADWTELKACVTDVLEAQSHTHTRKRYLYLTVLRDPVRRYVSEWRHVQRGATWRAARLACNGRSATLEEVPFCFHDEDWAGVSLEEFSACPHNLANNRQTRMLANLSIIGCYNRSALPAHRRDELMLESAKENLREMAYFGITEMQVESKFLFEHTFHIKFSDNFDQETQRVEGLELGDDVMRKITANNHLDIELYRYARELFAQRVEYSKSMYNNTSAAITDANTGDVTSASSPAIRRDERTGISNRKKDYTRSVSNSFDSINRAEDSTMVNRDSSAVNQNEFTSQNHKIPDNLKQVQRIMSEDDISVVSHQPKRHKLKLRVSTS